MRGGTGEDAGSTRKIGSPGRSANEDDLVARGIDDESGKCTEYIGAERTEYLDAEIVKCFGCKFDSAAWTSACEVFASDPEFRKCQTDLSLLSCGRVDSRFFVIDLFRLCIECV